MQLELETLTLTVDEDGLAHLILNRPDAANAMDPTMAAELRRVAIELEVSGAARAVLISANGRIFCSGGDLRHFAGAGDRFPHDVSDMTVDLHAAIARFARLDAPVIGAVQGAAGGAGMSLVASLDLVVAAESAKFTMGYTKAGLTPDGSSSWFLARCVGYRRAMDLVLTNRLLSATEAEEWGLVNRVVPDAELVDTAEALARQLAAGPTLALGHAKRLVAAGASAALEEAMENESEAIMRSATTHDAREGVGAFLDKRTPGYRGS